MADQLRELAAFLTDQQRPGHLALAEFARAPQATRDAFWQAIRKRTDLSRDFNRQIEEEAAELGLDFETFYRTYVGFMDRRHCRDQVRIWDQRWRDRAYRDRAIEQRGRRADDGFSAAKARLEGIEAEVYVERLSGEEVGRGGYMCCPLPDHDERTASFHVKETRFRCYGCQSHGSIYEFAGLLWGLARSGGDFRKIHDRLIEIFP